jgi:hypothetical protein
MSYVVYTSPPTTVIYRVTEVMAMRLKKGNSQVGCSYTSK